MNSNKDIAVMLKEAGILFAITLLSGLILGFVYELTKEPIRIQEERAIQEACSEVFESAAQFEEITYTLSGELSQELTADGVEIGSVFEALGTDGGLLGYVVQTTSTEGYGGNIVLYMGVTLEGTLNGISILEIAETPGLGMKAEDELAPQFQNKQAAAFTYTKTGSASDSEIDAISGATITTEAVTNAVNGGLKTVEALRQGGESGE